MLPFSVKIEFGIPIYQQIILAVKKALVSGQLREGDKFPSVRSLSAELNINPNTAQKIITYLEKEKIVEIMPGIGSVISRQAKKTMTNFLDEHEDKIKNLIIEAKMMNIPEKQFFEHLKKKWDKIEK